MIERYIQMANLPVEIGVALDKFLELHDIDYSQYHLIEDPNLEGYRLETHYCKADETCMCLLFVTHITNPEWQFLPWSGRNKTSNNS
jgi:hypothetical protein